MTSFSLSRPALAVLGTLRRCPAVGARRRVSTSAPRRLVEIESEKDFQQKVLQSDIPVIVDFYATWCGPCRSLTPLLEGVASEQHGEVELAKVDIDALPDLALQYGVSAVPSVVGVREGEVVTRFVGLRDADFLQQFAHDLIHSAVPAKDS